MNRKQKIIVSVTGIFIVLLILVGLTYAYFLTRINGNTNTKSISVNTKFLEVTYADDSNVITANNIGPNTTLDNKTFTVTNTGEDDAEYVVVLDNVNIKDKNNNTTTFESNDFVYTLTCTSSVGSCDSVNEETTLPLVNNGILIGNKISKNVVHTYTLSITYKETGNDQSNDMGKTLEMRVNINDIKSINPYSSNTSSLAYNIINNSMTGVNGTTLVGSPFTKVATDISSSNANSGIAGETIEIPLSELDSYLYYSSSSLKSDFENCVYNSDCSMATPYMTGTTNNEDLKGKYIYIDGPDYTSDTVTYVDDVVNNTIIINPVYESELSVAQDDKGTSYYYRGNVEDNYVDFAGKCWRIVRIDGDGNVKLILEDQNTTCENVNFTGNWQIDTANYGYEQKSFNGTTRYVASYLNPVTNSNNALKTKLDSWYTTNLSSYSSKLVLDTWCIGNETDLYELDENYEPTSTRLTQSKEELYTSGTRFSYETLKRLRLDNNATLRCNGTTYNSNIGTISADEVTYAGGNVRETNKNYYLINDWQQSGYRSFWTLSPDYFDRNYDNSFIVSNDGYVATNYVSSTYYGVRPVVSLKSNTEILSGEGTKANPYVIN